MEYLFLRGRLKSSHGFSRVYCVNMGGGGVNPKWRCFIYRFSDDIARSPWDCCSQQGHVFAMWMATAKYAQFFGDQLSYFCNFLISNFCFSLQKNTTLLEYLWIVISSNKMIGYIHYKSVSNNIELRERTSWDPLNLAEMKSNQLAHALYPESPPGLCAWVPLNDTLT